MLLLVIDSCKVFHGSDVVKRGAGGPNGVKPKPVLVYAGFLYTILGGVGAWHSPNRPQIKI